MRFMHCADLHLGGPNAAERMRAFERMLQICDRQDVQVLLVAGDLFDAPRTDERVVRAVMDAFAERSALCVLIAAGNHDPYLPGGCYDGALPDTVHVFRRDWSCVEIPAYGVRIWGASFAGEIEPPFAPERRALRLNECLCELGVLHGELTGPGAHSDYRAISPASIEQTGVAYLALGHIHARSEPARAGKTLYAYSGCAQGAGFEDLGEKGAYLGEVTENGVRLSFVRLCGSMAVEEALDVSGCGSLTEVATLYAERIGPRPDQRVRLRLVGTPRGFRIDAQALRRLLCLQAADLRVLDETRAGWDCEAIARENTLRGVFARRMLEKIARIERSNGDARTERLALELGLRAFEGEVEPDVD